MKRVIIVAAITLLLSSCQENHHERPCASSDAFDKTVGSRIALEKGTHWIANIKGSKEGPQHGEIYKLSHSNLERIKNSTANISGIAFTLGLDDNGVQHFVVSPINPEIHDWTGIIVDANTNTEITIETAIAWARKYRSVHEDGAISGYSFGIDIFKEIGEFPEFEMVQGLDDEKNLALMLRVNTAGINGRSKDAPPQYYDICCPCPPYCQKD